MSGEGLALVRWLRLSVRHLIRRRDDSVFDGTGRFGDGNGGSDSATEARGCVK